MKRSYFGRYLYKDSLVHGLNPLAKLAATAFLITAAALPGSALRTAACACLLAVLLALSKISLPEFWPSVRSFRFLILLTLIIQIFFNADGSFSPKPTEGAVFNAFLTAARFALIIAFSAVFTITTTPADIARSIYFFIKPFEAFGADTKEAAVSLLVAIRFIPLLFEESQKIVTAQKLRGAWEDGSLKSKFRFLTKAESFMIPLFTRVMHYAEQISVTLCYRDNLSAVMAVPKPAAADFVFVICALALSAALYAL